MHKRQHVYFGQTWAPNSIMSFHDRATAACTHLSLAREAESMQYLAAQISFQYSQHQDSEDIFPIHVKFAAPTCNVSLISLTNERDLDLFLVNLHELGDDGVRDFRLSQDVISFHLEAPKYTHGSFHNWQHQENTRSLGGSCSIFTRASFQSSTEQGRELHI